MLVKSTVANPYVLNTAASGILRSVAVADGPSAQTLFHRFLMLRQISWFSAGVVLHRAAWVYFTYFDGT